MDITVVLASVVVFMVIVFLLVGMLLGVKAKLLPSGPVKLMINGSEDVEVGSGSTLLTTFASRNTVISPPRDNHRCAFKRASAVRLLT